MIPEEKKEAQSINLDSKDSNQEKVLAEESKKEESKTVVAPA